MSYPRKPDLREEALARIDAFLKQRGWAETTLGARALKNSRAIGKLRRGDKLALTTIEKLLAFIDEQTAAWHRTGAWPLAAWPARRAWRRDIQPAEPDLGPPVKLPKTAYRPTRRKPRHEAAA